MTALEPPRWSPGTGGGRTHTPQEVRPGAPSRALRVRAAGGWERFMRRFAAEQPDQEDEA
ncbi:MULTISPECIES: hypothetical protein [Streptomyces]|uniref:Uncharacterized protein n=1 Tax=Streptomyces nymphaeiformis TaxID=2663842 RepID=A0A7W7U7H2_9ACTN|nr:hypothetical protein [Streptomyces nymphaeiformis]MBB4986324.1 hypothetical protein [Streptomyces nymphaeiformis]